jgi:hypothetical protein
MTEGQKRRTVGETKMNSVSSRSHAVLTLEIEQKDLGDDDNFSLKWSKLNLVDLAGSERATDTKAEGDRLKEGSSINASLSNLQTVIKALTEKAKHVPYRNSKLTRLLQDSLCGTSLVLLYCNVSPASVNGLETLSSLRFADQTKKLQTNVSVNRDPRNKRIAELMEENARLKTQLANAGCCCSIM